MNLLLKKFALLSTAIFLASTVFNDNVQAQRKSGGASLAELGCQRFAGLTDVNRDFSGGYTAVNQDVVIGGQLLRSFAVLGNIKQYGWQGIFREDPGPEKVACRLAPVNGSSEFRSLILQFGLSDSSRLSDGSVALRLKVSLDGEYYGEKLITRGDLIRWAIPVSGIRSVTLEGHCIRPKVYEQTCPNIWFTQDLLTR
jgi:hypothetical protein